MASSSLSLSPGSSLSASSSSSASSTSSSSSFYSKHARSRTLPRRGQVKAAIFASLFASIVRLLHGASKADGSTSSGAHSEDSGARSGAHRSDVELGLEGGVFELSARTSTASNLSTSGSATLGSPFGALSRSGSYHEGMHVKN